MASIIHFDISADNPVRAKKFYEEMFGWKIEKFPGSQMEYYLIETKTKSGAKGISGGIAQREKEYQQITNFIQVDSIDESISKLKELGGQVIEPMTEIPNIGFIAGCRDTEGNIIGLMELLH